MIKNKDDNRPRKTSIRKAIQIKNEFGYVTSRVCVYCGIMKMSHEFQKRKDTASGIVSYCKSCGLKRKREYYIKRKKNDKKKHYHICVHCGVNFESTRKTKMYCGDECASKATYKRSKLKIESSFKSTSHTKCYKCGTSIKTESITHKSRWWIGAPMMCAECKRQSARESERKRDSKPQMKARRNLSKRMHAMIKQAGHGGTTTLREMIGCSTAFLREHIQSQFKRGMTWDNYGSVWHVDHIHPVSSFDHSNKDAVRRCWHFTNLRPLMASLNIEKGCKHITHQPELLLQLA